MERDTDIIIAVWPERTDASGLRTPKYLAEFDYPPLLSGRRVKVVLTHDPARAARQDTQVVAESALDLLASLGYDRALTVRRDSAAVQPADTWEPEDAEF